MTKNKNDKLLKELIDERDRTKDRLKELHSAISSNDFHELSETQKALINEQVKALTKYLVVIYGRIGHLVE